MHKIVLPPLWDKDYVQKQENAIMEYLHIFWAPDDDKVEMMRSVMKASGGFCNPNVVDKIISKFKQKD